MNPDVELIIKDIHRAEEARNLLLESGVKANKDLYLDAVLYVNSSTMNIVDRILSSRAISFEWGQEMV